MSENNFIYGVDAQGNLIASASDVSTKVLKDTFRELAVLTDDDITMSLKYLMHMKGWLPVPKKAELFPFLKSINLKRATGPVSTVYKALYISGVSANFISELLTSQLQEAEKWNDLYRLMISVKGDFSIDSFLSGQISVILGRDVEEEVCAILDALWDQTIAVGNTAVGKGEICLTFLTGAMKASAGDLQLPDGSRLVEMKSNGGIIGSDVFAGDVGYRLDDILDITGEEFRKYVHSRDSRFRTHSEYAILHEQQFEMREEVKSILKDGAMMANYEILVRESKGKKPRIKHLRALENVKICKRFVNNIGKHDVPASCTGTGLNKNYLVGLKNRYNKMKDLQLNYNEDVDFDKSLSFQSFIRGFFLDTGFDLTTQQLIDGFVECRNSEYTLEKQVELKEAVTAFFETHPVRDLREHRKLERYIVTLHLIGYWLKTGFTDIQLTIDESRCTVVASMPPENSSLAFAFAFIYDQVESIRTRFDLGGHIPTSVRIYMENK